MVCGRIEKEMRLSRPGTCAEGLLVMTTQIVSRESLCGKVLVVQLKGKL